MTKIPSVEELIKSLPKHYSNVRCSEDNPMVPLSSVKQSLQAQRDAGSEEERKRIEEQFPDYAHTRYLGCYEEGGRWHYSYDTEVIHLFADFLTPPTK